MRRAPTAVLATGLLGFAILAGLQLAGAMEAFDLSVMSWLPPARPGWLTNSLSDITALGGYTALTLLTIAAAIRLVLAKDYLTALITVAAVSSSGLLTHVMKLAFDRARPDLIDHLTHSASSSFPSGHALQSTTAFLFVGALMARGATGGLKAFYLGGALLLAVLVGVSRVYLGVHWPTDVLAGWCLGVAWAALWCLVLRRGTVN